MIGRYLFHVTKPSQSVFQVLILFLFLVFIAPVFSGDLNWIGHVLLLSSSTGSVVASIYLNGFIKALAVDLMKRAHTKKQCRRMAADVDARNGAKDGE